MYHNNKKKQLNYTLKIVLIVEDWSSTMEDSLLLTHIIFVSNNKKSFAEAGSWNQKRIHEIKIDHQICRYS